MLTGGTSLPKLELWLTPLYLLFSQQEGAPIKYLYFQILKCSGKTT
jgi:hypothetical protein